MNISLQKYFVFGDINSIHPDVLRSHKNEYAKKAEVKEIRIHDFRHSCASLLINNGANIMIVAKYLGHAKIDETLNTYSHLFKNKMDDIVN
ncbi:MAG: tyrosine-type recombinase/integrase [Bacilli bacterium]|nr:tyrosine-type recombinase/integrase [Bacilli bacterium]